MQKACFYTVKGGFSESKRWHIANYNSKSIIRAITDVNFTLVNFNQGKICLQVNRNQKFNDCLTLKKVDS